MFKDMRSACRAARHHHYTTLLTRTHCVTQGHPQSVKGWDKTHREALHFRNCKHRASSLWEFSPLTPLHSYGTWHQNPSKSLALLCLHHTGQRGRAGSSTKAMNLLPRFLKGLWRCTALTQSDTMQMKLNLKKVLKLWLVLSPNNPC